jgi:hypothetical protein
MPSGTEANIFKALMDRLTALSFTPAQPIASPFIAFPPAGQTKPKDYLEVTFISGPTNTRTLGPGRQQHRGIMQVTVHYSSGTGIIVPMQRADQIIAHFPKDFVLHESGVRVKIYRKPYQTQLPPQNGSLMVPVTIQYETFAA